MLLLICLYKTKSVHVFTKWISHYGFKKQVTDINMMLMTYL